MVGLVKKKILYTLKTEVYHLLAALAAAILVYVLFGDIKYSLLAIAVAIFVDVDHLLDYFLAIGFRIDVRGFLSGEFFDRWERLIIIFHGWEYVFIFLALFLFTKNPIFAALSISLFAHYTVDFFTNRCMHRFGYFILYRAYNKFDKGRIL